MRHILIAAIALFTLACSGESTNAEERGEQRTWPLEGVLKVHPKFLYHYYLVVGPNQICALYGPDHERKPNTLSRFKEGSRIRVRGTLGTYHHPGSTDENLSPFPPTWLLYMDVHEVHEAKMAVAEGEDR